MAATMQIIATQREIRGAVLLTKGSVQKKYGNRPFKRLRNHILEPILLMTTPTPSPRGDTVLGPLMTIGHGHNVEVSRLPFWRTVDICKPHPL